MIGGQHGSAEDQKGGGGAANSILRERLSARIRSADRRWEVVAVPRRKGKMLVQWHPLGLERIARR